MLLGESNGTKDGTLPQLRSVNTPRNYAKLSPAQSDPKLVSLKTNLRHVANNEVATAQLKQQKKQLLVDSLGATGTLQLSLTDSLPKRSSRSQLKKRCSSNIAQVR